MALASILVMVERWLPELRCTASRPLYNLPFLKMAAHLTYEHEFDFDDRAHRLNMVAIPGTPPTGFFCPTCYDTPE